MDTPIVSRPYVGGTPPAPVPLRQRSRRPIRKLRVAAGAGLLAAVLLPLVNAALQRAGLPAVTADDVRAVWDLGLAAYGSVAAAVAWLAAYLTRPRAEDAPVRDERPLVVDVP